MKHLNKHTSKILKLGVAGILFFSSFTFIEAKNPEPIKAKTPISNTSVMKAPQNLSANFFQSLKTAISKIQPTKTLTTTSSQKVGSFTVEGDATGYSYTESDQGNFVLTFSKSGNYKITGDGNEVTNQTIAVGSNFEGTITLENVNIASKVASPFFVDNTAKLTIDLKGKNKLNTTNQKNATIDFSNATGDAHLTITSNEDGSLDCNNEGSSAAIGGGEGLSGNNITIAGGKITASSSDGAGVGGGSNSPGSNITINGGTVTATGGNFGAGIGGGSNGSGSNITITGGAVTATGGVSGAGIGSGAKCLGSNITISGGTVTATGGDNAAGIGGGIEGTASNITINGGTVTAIGRFKGAGIGGGDSRPGNDITINGGTVTATSNDGAGIGGGYSAISENIKISGGNVVASGNVGIGSSKYVENIEISGGTITATGSDRNHGIGNFLNDSTQDMVIKGGSINATLGTIPKNENGEELTQIKIDNTTNVDKVIVNGKDYEISNNHDNDNSLYIYAPKDTTKPTIISVTDTAGEVKLYQAISNGVDESITVVEKDLLLLDENGNMATSGYTYESNVLTIQTSGTYTIQGLKPTTDRVVVAEGFHGTIILDNVNIDVSDLSGITAFKVNNTAHLALKLKNTNTLKSGENKAGLQFCDASNITSGELVITSIDGDGETSGSLTAVGGFYGAGIGGGSNQIVNNITIQGGTIESISGNCAAGIGGGDQGAANNITITGGIVKALGKGNETTGIGGGRSAIGNNIKIFGGDVTAKGVWSAGIGGGEMVDNEGIGSNITISGGNVNAYSENGAGIGGGEFSSAANITIKGGNVTATSKLGSGIGSGKTYDGYVTSAKNIEINGGTVIAKSEQGAGIGGGRNSDAEIIKITGGAVTASSYEGAGIGGSKDGTVKDIEISGGTITVNSKSGAGIGAGINGSAENIIITGGSVKGKLSCVPTDGNGNNVYLAQLKSQSDINEIKVDENSFKRAGNHLDDNETYTDDTFYLYLTEDNHRLTETKDSKSYLALNDKEAQSFVIEEVNAGDFRVLDDTGQMATTGYTYDSSSNILTMNKEASNYTIKGFLTTKERIVVTEGFNGAITIDNVNIDVSDKNGITAFKVNNIAKLTLKLKNKNTLKSGNNSAGLQFCDANNITSGELVITSIDGKEKTNGSLYAVGGVYGAGIGGFSNQFVKNITIEGGTIEAIPGNCAAAIGGGDAGSASNITITGGIVKALGDADETTGIGGGRGANGEDITISGGDVTAKGVWGAGIGGGEKNDNAPGLGMNIKITGGKVSAYSEDGAGIGGGYVSSAENITINGGNVTAISKSGSGIGGGKNYSTYFTSAKNITITGGTVTAKGGLAFDIGGDSTERTENIIISGGSVKGTLGCEPKDKEGNKVYLAKLENQPDINEVKTATVTFKREGNHIDEDGKYTDNAFYMYLTSNNHTVTSDGVQHGARWNSIDGFNWITESSYNLTIPASINLNEKNALETSIDNVALVDTTKEVNVKVSNSTDITEGKLNLKRENGMENQISTSLVSFDKEGKSLVNKGSNLFTVEDMGTASKTLYFNKPISPTGDLILAGNYTGIINFEVSID